MFNLRNVLELVLAIVSQFEQLPATGQAALIMAFLSAFIIRVGVPNKFR